MTEYVCELDRESVREVSEGVIGVKLVTIDDVTAVHERVIRCRDCASWRTSRGDGHKFCEQTGQRCDGDGFCAWAQPREDA